MRIGWPGQARLSLVRQSPLLLLRGRFSFQDEVAGSSPARPTISALSCGNACRSSFGYRLGCIPGRDEVGASRLSVERHRFEQRVRVDRASLQRGDLGCTALQGRIPAAASMNPYCALRNARGKRSPYLQHLFGSRGGVAGPVRLHARLPPCRRFVGAGVVWIRRHMPGGENVTEPLLRWLRLA
jgi:hypothetical protein